MNNYSGDETVNAGTGKELTIKNLQNLLLRLLDMMVRFSGIQQSLMVHQESFLTYLRQRSLAGNIRQS